MLQNRECRLWISLFLNASNIQKPSQMFKIYPKKNNKSKKLFKKTKSTVNKISHPVLRSYFPFMLDKTWLKMFVWTSHLSSNRIYPHKESSVELGQQNLSIKWNVVLENCSFCTFPCCQSTSSAMYQEMWVKLIFCLFFSTILWVHIFIPCRAVGSYLSFFRVFVNSLRVNSCYLNCSNVGVTCTPHHNL